VVAKGGVALSTGASGTHSPGISSPVNATTGGHYFGLFFFFFFFSSLELSIKSY
jgi:hypothetical protein